MTSENDAEFVERIKRDWDGDNVPCVEDFDQLIAIARRGAAYAQKGFTAGWVLGRADAAKVLDDMPCAPPQGINDYWAGYRAALTYGAIHIRALPPPPAGETSDE